jgi:hypothetical protein
VAPERCASKFLKLDFEPVWGLQILRVARATGESEDDNADAGNKTVKTIHAPIAHGTVVGKRVMTAEMETPAIQRKRWLGIDFSGDYRKWSPGCNNSNVWIADVRREDQFVLCDLKTVQELPGSGVPFDRLGELLKSRNFDAAGIDAPFSVPAKYVPAGDHRKLLEVVCQIQRSGGRCFPSGRRLRRSDRRGSRANHQEAAPQNRKTLAEAAGERAFDLVGWAERRGCHDVGLPHIAQ